ncbi:survival protein sure-like phosphatase/nucleotidase [Achaetomium macrosporum]|uniref:Survival protein sure-like phosphatase/nucleotidase n=1 Tax=Achaetomium macrosporum TaxID=79813 RepID=A0AAN7HHX4_9PEZI|nr:survival protein sure-like phosphatase/nucleotidase [Achaetomium macrosporum]
MHILVVNDDGPPSPHSSPYVHSLVRELQSHGHVVSVCLPHTQRSWIGKAHMIGQTVKPLYYRPPPPSAPAAGLSDDDDDRNGQQTGTGTKAGSQEKNNGRARHGTTHNRPSTRPGTEEWILVDGTPASCVQIGLYHFFRDRGPVDLVVSGPNYGRNTTAVFALSSGTLGGALEAAVCRHRAIALSYAFFSRNHDTSIIQKASRQSVRVIEALARDWPTDGSVDLYSVNVPLLERLEEGKVLFTEMLQNYWGSGSCFTEVDGSVDGEEEEEERIREGEGEAEEEAAGGANGAAQGKMACHTHKHFKWSPRFADVYQSVDEAPPGNDGWAVKEGHTSVTPLKANFFQTATHLHGKELQLGRPSRSSTFGAVVKHSAINETASTGGSRNLPLREKKKSQTYALIDYDDDYVQPLILSAMESLLPPKSYASVQPPSSWSPSSPDVSLADLVPEPDAKVVQIMPYESIDFDYAAAHPDTCLVNSYVIRKALIRKHFLSATVDNWVAKQPGSVLKTHVKRSEAFEVDYAEFLDDALVEAFDLRESLERNEALRNGSNGNDAENVAEQSAGTTPAAKENATEWWILKPSMSDRGQGIRLFSTMEQLQGIFDGWEVSSEDEDEGDDDDDTHSGGAYNTTNANTETDKDGPIMTSHLRHFIAQPYIHPPLLLPEFNNRKFHIRVYVLCVGSLAVYVYRDMLALFAAKPYQPPRSGSVTDLDLDAHLTNTCLQTSSSSTSTAKEGLVHRFSALPLPAEQSASIFAQICEVTGELFEAAARGMPIHFQPLPQAFEVYGLDFLVDAAGKAWLLEVNAFPDFKQTGEGLTGVVGGFWRGVVRRAVVPFVTGDGNGGGNDDDDDGMVLVREVDLGRRQA